jgi:alkylation response protein AidB-like acyl-CoA dehydrogenase
MRWIGEGDISGVMEMGFAKTNQAGGSKRISLLLLPILK